MINIPEERVEKMRKTFPDEMESIKNKMNMLGHLYFTLLDFVAKLGLKTEFLESLRFEEKEIFRGLNYCRGKEVD